MKVTIITVVYNDEDRLKKTVLSVLSQTMYDYEYIIKDGISKDNTIQIAESYRNAFKEKGVNYTIASQGDSGIYDAMNQAIEIAKGEYVIFLNAGDRFVNDKTLEKVIRIIDCNDAEIVYGDTICSTHELFKYNPARSLNCIDERMPFCHQSVFVARELLMIEKFNIKYKICADQEFFLRCYINKKRFNYINIPVSIFEIDGFSSQNLSKGLWDERLTIERQYKRISNKEYEEKKRKLEKLYKKRKHRFLIKRLFPIGAYKLYLEMKGWSRSIQEAIQVAGDRSSKTSHTYRNLGERSTVHEDK